MSLRIFDEPHEAIEPVEQAHAPIAARLLFSFWAVLMVVIPAFAAAYAALRITYLFRNITTAESAGSAYILGGLSASNLPLVIALVASGLLAFGMALALVISPKNRLAGVGLPLSIAVPILAATPGLFLWGAESKVVDLLSGKVTNVSVSAFAQTVSTLLFIALGSGLLLQGVVLLCAIVSLFIPVRSRTDPLSLPRVFVWLVSGVLLLMFAGLIFVLV